MVILCVDDDPEDREIFFEAVKESFTDVTFISADDGEAAYDLLTNPLTGIPDYIFLDINMPLMDGIKCLTLIKGNRNLKNIPVIVYSTTSSKQEIAKVESMGAQFLLKESDYRKLIFRISEILSHRKV
jgi:CheY-like chemotaxis protein